MTYRDSTRALADASEEQVTAAEETVDVDELAVVVAGIIAVYNARAVALADLSLATFLGTLPLGLPPVPGDADRLVGAVLTIRSDIGTTPGEVRAALQDEAVRAAQLARLRRLARSEPLTAGRDAYSRAMTARDVPGWTRRTGGSPCPLCSSLADGTVLPPGARMADHPGCSCVAVPVLEPST